MTTTDRLTIWVEVHPGVWNSATGSESADSEPRIRPGVYIFYRRLTTLPRQPANRAGKRRILNRESALRLLDVRNHSVVGRIRGSESAAFRPGWHHLSARVSDLEAGSTPNRQPTSVRSRSVSTPTPVQWRSKREGKSSLTGDSPLNVGNFRGHKT